MDQDSEENVLKSFFAVTKTSVYEAIIADADNVPFLKKIALRGQSNVLTGGKITNGTMLAICRHLQLFIPEGSGLISPMATYQREIASVNTRYWGGGTSDIVALFLKKEDALDCNCQTDLLPLDPRWKDKTVEVLRAVGNNHPCCSITNHEGLRLMAVEEWKQ
jgi:hypothetical protein